MIGKIDRGSGTEKKTSLEFDLDQRVLIRSLVRFPKNYVCAPRGSAKCLKFSSLIFTEDGIKEIGSLIDYSKEEKEKTQNIGIANRFGKVEQSLTVIANGKRKIKNITTEEGYEIGGTLNHPLMVMGRDGRLGWKNIEDIKIGDHICVQRKSDLWGKNVDLNVDMDSFLKEKSKRVKERALTHALPSKLDGDLAYIIGLLLGDGSLTRDSRIMFINPDKELVDAYLDYFKRFNIDVIEGDNLHYNINSVYIREFFRQIGLKQAGAFWKEIPKLIMEAPKEMVIQTIKGLFDTDGTVTSKAVELCTASEKMAKQVQIILNNLGIISRRKKGFNKQFQTYHYKVQITTVNIDLYRDIIGFNQKSKAERLDKLCKLKRNPNKDVIPYQKENITAIYPKGYTRDKFYHVIKGNNELTYGKLGLLNDDTERFENKESEEFQYLKMLYDLNYFYSKVETIEDDEDYVYDVYMPYSHSFIGNGIVSHNTFIHILAAYHMAIFYPNITISVLASTKQASVEIWQDKHEEIISLVPYLADCIKSANFSKDRGVVEFVNGSKIDKYLSHMLAIA